VAGPHRGEILLYDANGNPISKTECDERNAKRSLQAPQQYRALVACGALGQLLAEATKWIFLALWLAAGCTLGTDDKSAREGNERAACTVARSKESVQRTTIINNGWITIEKH